MTGSKSNEDSTNMYNYNIYNYNDNYIIIIYKKLNLPWIQDGNR